MAATIPYWRVLFYPDKPEINSSINVAKLIPQDSDGADIGGSPTLAAEKQHDAIGYPLANILDGVSTTYAVLAWAAADQERAAISFQWALPTSVDRFLIRFNNTDTVYGTRLASAKVHILVQFSWNGTEWTTSAIVGNQVLLGNTDYYIPAVRSSAVNPGQFHANERGAGGIYGVVSEDSVAANGYPVAALSRTTMDRIAYTLSEADGGYTLNGLNPDNEYLVLAVDPSGPTPKNAIVWDRVKPIPSTKYVASDDRFLAHRLRDPYLGPTLAYSDVVPTLYPYVVPYGGFNHYAGANTAISDSYEIFGDIQYDHVEIADVSNVAGLNFFARSDFANPLSAGNGGHLGGGVHPSAPVTTWNLEDSVLNYQAFTWEMIVIPPAVGEATAGLLLQLGGLPKDWMNLSDSYSALHSYASSNGSTYRRSLVMDFRDSYLTVRANLGGYNASVERVQVALTPSVPVHVVVTYLDSTEFKVYVNGVLQGTGAIPGAGRLYTAANGSNQWGAANAVWELSNTNDFDNYNSSVTTPSASYSYNSGPAGVINQFLLRTFNYGTQGGYFWSAKTAWGGAIAFFATYFGVKDAAAVADLYDSYQNPTGFQVLPTQSGYAAQVEADNPVQYYPLSEATVPASMLRAAVGRKDLPLELVGTAGALNAAGNLTGGKTCYYAGSTGSYFRSFSNPAVGVPFTFECWFNVSDLGSNRALWALESPFGNSNILDLFINTDGKVALSLLSVSGTQTDIVFPVAVADEIQTGTIYHLVVTYDPVSSGEANLYLNGSLVSSLVASAVHNIQAVYMLRFALDGNASAYFLGYLGEIALYGHVLSADRVAAHYAARND